MVACKNILMRYAWILVDGFSLLYREAGALSALKAGRRFEACRRLVRRLDRLAGLLADRLTIVFDGQGAGGPSDEALDVAVEVVFSPSGQTADTVIERMARDAERPQDVLVVTSDRMERETVDSSGAASMGCTDFLAWVEREERALDRRGGPRPPAPGGGWPSTLGDQIGDRLGKERPSREDGGA
jgi:predicted RNA-binding protein with PIN domain